MSDPRPTLHLIDGSGYIFRAYYAVRPLQSRKGVPTNAVMGFARMLLRLLREEAPQHLAIAFDTGEPTFRHTMYADYKAHRDAPPEDLVPQFALIHALVDAMNIPRLLEVGYEADDLLATLAQQAVAAGYDVVLVSGDKDLMQLVGPHIGMFDPLKEKHYDRAAVTERFGVPPEHVADVLALAGDSSDNIPGVPKVGAKGAAKLVQAYGDVEAIIAGLAGLAKPKAAEASVLAHADLARLSKRLAVLSDSAPVQFDAQSLAYSRPDAAKLSALLTELDAQTLLRDFDVDAISPAAAAQAQAQVQATLAGPTGAEPAASIQIDRAAYRTLWDLAALDALIAAAGRVGRLSVDLETTSLVAARAEVVGVALCVPGDVAVYVPVGHSGEDAQAQLDRADVLARLKPLLEDPQVVKVGQNLKYDWVVLARVGIELAGIGDDAMLAAYILDPSRPGYGMDALSRDMLGHRPLTYKEVTEGRKGDLGFVAVPVATATAYAAEDADVALRLCDHMRPLLQQSGGARLYHDLEVPLVPVLARMEHHGILVDSAQLGDLGAEFGTRLRRLEDEAYALIGSPINLASPKQLAELFFVKLGYPALKRTKTGFSTDQEVLETLARTYDLPRLVLAHRTLAKLKSTYVDSLPRLAVAETGRVHTSFNQTGTATGRLSSSDPNLQNIPIRTEDGRRIRAAFVAPPGWMLVSADYSQIELRVLAHLSEDKKFIAAFIAGEDIHRQTAMAILSHGKPPTAEMRRQAKAINFGILYGLSEFGLSRQLNIGRAEARDYIGAYFARYPDIQHYLDSTIERARQEGYVSTLTGRRRFLPDLRSQNGNVRQGAERIAKNTPIQGSAADLIKIAMLRVQARLSAERLQARMLLQVHDELVLEAPESEVPAVRTLLSEEMAQVMPLRVPLLVQVGHGPNWADAH